MLAHEVSQATRSQATYDAFTISFEPHGSLNVIERALQELRSRDMQEMCPAIEEKAIAGLKSSTCLPLEMSISTLETRLRDNGAVAANLEQDTHFVT